MRLIRLTSWDVKRLPVEIRDRLAELVESGGRQTRGETGRRLRTLAGGYPPLLDCLLDDLVHVRHRLVDAAEA